MKKIEKANHQQTTVVGLHLSSLVISLFIFLSISSLESLGYNQRNRMEIKIPYIYIYIHIYIYMYDSFFHLDYIICCPFTKPPR